jgi:hypothetical protein
MSLLLKQSYLFAVLYLLHCNKAACICLLKRNINMENAHFKGLIHENPRYSDFPASKLSHTANVLQFTTTRRFIISMQIYILYYCLYITHILYTLNMYCTFLAIALQHHIPGR